MSTDLSRIQAAEGIFVTDANTQFSPLLTTVPAGTEAGLAVRDCTIGQNTMANSRPVVIASNQSTLTIQGALTHNNAAPGATNIGALVALCNTAAPTYTNGDQVLLSVDTSGSLRVNVASTVTQATNITQIAGNSVSTSAAGIQKIGISDSAGSSITIGQKTSANSVPVVIASDQSAISVTNTQLAAITGTITTSSSTVSTTTASYNAVTVSVNGTYAGVNFTFEASDDNGTTYYTVSATRMDTNQAVTSTGLLTNSNIMWAVYLNAVTNFRVRATAYTSGTANIHLTLSAIGSDSSVGANVYEIGGSAISLGQNTMANSIPVAIASNQTNTVGSGSNYSLTVGTSAVQLTAAAATQGVQIVADPAGGSNYIYVGLSSSVTAGTNASTDGLKLAAGAGVTWPLSNANLVWAIASAASQKIFVAVF